MNWLRRQLPLICLLACGAVAIYCADPDGLRALGHKPAAAVVKEIALPLEAPVPHARGVMRLSPLWTVSLLHATGKPMDFEPPADPIVRELVAQSRGYVDEIASARAFVDAYRTTAAAPLDWGPDHPYRLALSQRREDLRLIAALRAHSLGDAASLQDLTSRRSSAANPWDNRALPLCIDALVKLEQLREQHPPPTESLNRWISTWNPHSDSSRQAIEELRRRAGAYRRYAKDHPQVSAWARLAANEAKQADELALALDQLQPSEKADAVKNLRALHVILSALDVDRHPQAFVRARQVIVEWCKTEAPGDLPLDKVWIGSPRKTAFERREVKIDWGDGDITTLDQPHRGIVYHEESLRRLDKDVKSKITIFTPLGSGAPDDLIASDATLHALAFNEAARQLRLRLAEPSSYRKIADAFRRVRLAALADELVRFQKWER